MKKSTNHFIVDSMREIVFGLEDSLVSTLGAITGIALATRSTYIVILSGLVLIAAEGMSMTAGSYLSSKSAVDAEQQFHKSKQKEVRHPIRSASVMGVSYFLGGFVPLLPYFFLPIHTAVLPSVIGTGIVLFSLGVWAATYTKRSKIKSGLEMVIISLLAAGMGYVIGQLVRGYFGVEVGV